VAKLLDRSGLKWERRSQLESTAHDPAARILLIDVVGELGAWWGTATIAYVGGSLSRRGGQNMIEPAAYGSAVCFGPNTWNFKDVVQLLLHSEAAHVVQNGAELQTFLRRCLSDPQFAHALGKRAQELVIAQQGAADRTLVFLQGLAASSLTKTIPTPAAIKKPRPPRRQAG
jgi:3-deoxy-D-manno-octulosonic-acid transferase